MEAKYDQNTKKTPHGDVLLSVDDLMAGDESLNWHRISADFILLGQKLEKLGFSYESIRANAILSM